MTLRNITAAIARRNPVDEWGDTFTTDAPNVLALIRPRWMAHAACAGQDREAWFPEVGSSADAPKRICATCTVRADCLAWGLSEEFGIFGGLNRADRKKLAASGWQAGDPIPAVRLQGFGVSHGTEGGYALHVQRGEKPCATCEAWRERRRGQQRRTHQARRLRLLDGAA